MSEVMITVVGNVATEPRLDETKKGEMFASFRLACNGQRYDARARSWVDDDTSFYTVYCWRTPLADNIKTSLRRGDPVVVHGRLKNREWRDDQRVVHVSPEITAHSLGHDLYRGTSSFTKVSRQPFLPEDDEAVDSVRAAYLALHDELGAVQSGVSQLSELSSDGLPAALPPGRERPADPVPVNGRSSTAPADPARVPRGTPPMEVASTGTPTETPSTGAAPLEVPSTGAAPRATPTPSPSLSLSPRSGEPTRREKAGVPG